MKLWKRNTSPMVMTSYLSCFNFDTISVISKMNIFFISLIPIEIAHMSCDQHVGDLGNIRFDARGVAKFRMVDSLVKLRGTKANVIGRSLVVHEDMDDLGMGNHSDSLTTGHAGKRITCAVIGYSKRMCIKT
jgi:hypothetical protein